MYEDEAWGKPRPASGCRRRWATATGPRRFTIMSSMRPAVPPSAGSASGVLPNPVGYNRVYVHLDKELNYTDWWNGLRRGVRSSPTARSCESGPMASSPVTSSPPPRARRCKIDLKAELTTQDPIRFVEIIKNGQVERRVPFEEVVRSRLARRTSSSGRAAGSWSAPSLRTRRPSASRRRRPSTSKSGKRRSGSARRRLSSSSTGRASAWLVSSSTTRRGAKKCLPTTGWPRDSGKNGRPVECEVASARTVG